MRQVDDRRRKLMVELMREVGFGIPVMPQGAFYVFADASKWTDDAYAYAFELLEKAGVGVAPGVDFGQAGKRAVRFSYATGEGTAATPAIRSPRSCPPGRSTPYNDARPRSGPG